MAPQNMSGSGLSIEKILVGKAEFDEAIEVLKEFIEEKSKFSNDELDKCLEQVFETVGNFRKVFKEMNELHEDLIRHSLSLSNEQIKNMESEIKEFTSLVSSLDLKERLEQLRSLKELEQETNLEIFNEIKEEQELAKEEQELAKADREEIKELLIELLEESKTPDPADVPKQDPVYREELIVPTYSDLKEFTFTDVDEGIVINKTLFHKAGVYKKVKGKWKLQ